MIGKYGRAVQWKFHLFPLPYHTWAFSVARGAYALASVGNDSTTLKYFDLAFERQSQVTGGVGRKLCKAGWTAHRSLQPQSPPFSDPLL